MAARREEALGQALVTAERHDADRTRRPTKAPPFEALHTTGGDRRGVCGNARNGPDSGRIPAVRGHRLISFMMRPTDHTVLGYTLRPVKITIAAIARAWVSRESGHPRHGRLRATR